VPIVAIASAVPDRVEDAAAIAAVTGAKVDFIIDKVGLRERHVLGPGEGGVDLAATACRRLLAATGCEAGAVDLVVFVTQTPDYPIPHNSALLAARLGLPDSLAAYDLNLGCSGYVYGLSQVEHFLAGEGLETALLVTCDPYTRIVAPEDKATNALFGDAATATLMRRSSGRGTIGRADFGTDGTSYKALIREAGGAMKPLIGALDAAQPVYRRDELRLRMNGREVYNFVMDRMPASVDACLAKNRLTLADIDLFAFHQGSRYMVEQLAARVGAPEEKLLFNIERYGNTVSSTIPLLLEEVLAGERRPYRVLVCGFGVGLSWATNVIAFD